MAGHVRIALLFEVTGAGASNEPRVTRRVVPPDSLVIRDDRLRGSTAATTVLRILFSTAVSTAMPASAASLAPFAPFAPFATVLGSLAPGAI